MCVCLHGGTDGDRKKDGSPVRSSAKDSGSSEKRFLRSHTDVTFDVCYSSFKLLFLHLPVVASCKASAESPASPTVPPHMASFPPAAVTSDNVRSKSRELLVVALQTDGEDGWRRCRWWLGGGWLQL